jgi:hypothetical protein
MAGKGVVRRTTLPEHDPAEARVLRTRLKCNRAQRGRIDVITGVRCSRSRRGTDKDFDALIYGDGFRPIIPLAKVPSLPCR